MSELQKKLFVRAIELKLRRGEDFETILAGYTRLSDEEKAELRAFFGR